MAEGPEPSHALGEGTRANAADRRLAPCAARRSGDADARIKGMIEDLKAAVDSIPAYVERCSMMWVLVPPVAHSNLTDTICDFSSWRRRGWCRMEFAACKLSCGPDMPLMVSSGITLTLTLTLALALTLTLTLTLTLAR